MKEFSWKESAEPRPSPEKTGVLNCEKCTSSALWQTVPMTLFEEYEFRNVQIDQHGALAVLTVNRPTALNALNGETLSELAQVTDIVAENAEIGALIITGGGERAFVAGADISELAQLEGVFAGRELSLAGQDVMHGIASLPIPTIAAIGGFALGGGLELALACDVRIASRTARLGLPEVTLGLLPGFGGTQRLSRLIGAGRALDLMLTGRQLPAEEALSMGLVNYVADNPLEKAREVAEAMLKNAPHRAVAGQGGGAARPGHHPRTRAGDRGRPVRHDRRHPGLPRGHRRVSGQTPRQLQG